jgi:hypothetical protein
MPRVLSLIGFGLIVAAFPTLTRGADFSTGPIPQYKANVTQNNAIDKQSSTIATTDKVDQVETWFKDNLPKGTTEKTTDDGARLFYLPNGATVDVERDGQGTMIGMTWQAR